MKRSAIFVFSLGTMRSCLVGKNNAEKGITLLLVVLVLSALLSISLGIVSSVLTEIRLSGELADSFKALYAADFGIEKLYYLDRVADAICNPVDPQTGVFPPCPPYKNGISLPITIGPLANGSCMKVSLSRASNLVSIYSVGQFNCASPELSVKRGLFSSYRKDITSNFPTPVGFWKFDEGAGLVANDSSGIDNAGVLANGPTWTAGKVGAALTFDGTNDYVDVSGFSSTGGPITVSFWNYVSSADVRASSAFSVGDNGPGTNRLQAHAPWSDQNLYWDYGNISGNGRISTSYASYLNKWTFVTLVSAGVSGNFKAIYLDGVLVASSNSSDGASRTDLNIGRFFGGNVYEKGRIDEFRIYNVVLTQPQIQTVMNSLSGGGGAAPASVDVLVVGGGGGGGNSPDRTGGGGGAGGVITTSGYAVTAQAYAVTVGSGGSANAAGSNSVFGPFTAIGGGRGGQKTTGATTGGSGGGAFHNPADSGKAGTSGQGNAGGNGYDSGDGINGTFGAGGGGGQSQVGANGVAASGGKGGNGYTSSISGSSVVYAGGGGGACQHLGSSSCSAGAGGIGGGGAGGNSGSAGTAGIINTGGGGGGGSSVGAGAGAAGGAGGSGIIIISYPTGSMNATGGTITTSGGYTIHTFTSSGTFTVL